MTGAYSLLAMLAAIGAGGQAPPQEVVRPVLTPLPPRLSVPAPVRTPLPEPEDLGARLLAPAALHASPGGALVGRVGTQTQFGSPQILPVIHRRIGTPETAANEIALIEPPGFLMLNYGRNTFVVTLVSHAVYGAIVGWAVRV